MVFCKRVFSSIYRERNGFKTFYLELICSEKELKTLKKSAKKQSGKTDFRIAQKRKEPLAVAGLAVDRVGRPPAQLVKEPLARVFWRSTGRSTQKTREQLLTVGRPGRSTDRRAQMCTSWHRRRSAGQPETGKTVYFLD